jgi:hypothetical protein
VPRRKAFDLVGRLHQSQACHGSRNLRQSTGQGKGQVGASNRWDCRHKKWDAKRRAPFKAKLRQRTVYRSLLIVPCFNNRMGKVEILLQREAVPANSLSGAYESL